MVGYSLATSRLLCPLAVLCEYDRPFVHQSISWSVQCKLMSLHSLMNFFKQAYRAGRRAPISIVLT